ncbi:hypothetical protein MalM25_17130 [Planctomycetes bacterium MalM25]|nr:hypothetical protein MalM25_17130 [Planctomycetes bacterium MalM25]
MSVRWLATLALTLGTAASSQAALFFYDNGGGDALFSNAANWDPDGNPGPADLAVANNGSLPAIIVDSNVSPDSLRLSDGGKVSHTAGTLTIANGTGPDAGLWVGEFGPGTSTYTLNGGTLQIDDPGDGFQVGRAGGSNGTFTLLSGTVNNTAGDTVIGLDGTATWNQAGGTFNGAGVQIGLFASPNSTVNLGGSAEWNVGLVLLADGHGVFTPRNPAPVNLNLNGPNVSFSSVGLVMQDEGNLMFNGAGGGISTVDIGGDQFLLNNGELFLENLPAPTGFGDSLVLIDNIGSYTGSDMQFDNAPQGTAFGDWTIDYSVASQVRLVAIPEPTAMLLMISGVGMIAARRR